MNSSITVVSAVLIFLAVGIGAQNNGREHIPHHTSIYHTTTHYPTTHNTTTHYPTTQSTTHYTTTYPTTHYTTTYPTTHYTTTYPTTHYTTTYPTTHYTTTYPTTHYTTTYPTTHYTTTYPTTHYTTTYPTTHYTTTYPTTHYTTTYPTTHYTTTYPTTHYTTTYPTTHYTTTYPTTHYTTTNHTTTYYTTTNHTTTHHTSIRHDVEVRQAPLMEVLTGRKVAFSVGKATENLHAVTRLHFSDVFANVGGGWDPATSEFVAPYDGLYFFIFHAVGANDTDFTLALMKNWKFEVTAYGTLATYEHGTNSVVLELKHQDKVSLELQQGAIYEHPGNETYTTFTGFLMLDE